MDETTFLPHILDILTSQPKLCDTFENIYMAIRSNLTLSEKEKCGGHLRQYIKRSLGFGQKLGLLTLTSEMYISKGRSKLRTDCSYIPMNNTHRNIFNIVRQPMKRCRQLPLLEKRYMNCRKKTKSTQTSEMNLKYIMEILKIKNPSNKMRFIQL